MIQSTLRCSMLQPMAKFVYVFSEKSRVIKVFKMTCVIRKFWDSNSWSSVLGTSCLYVYTYQNNFLWFSIGWLGGKFFVSSFYVKFQCKDFLIFSFKLLFGAASGRLVHLYVEPALIVIEPLRYQQVTVKFSFCSRKCCKICCSNWNISEKC